MSCSATAEATTSRHAAAVELAFRHVHRISVGGVGRRRTSTTPLTVQRPYPRRGASGRPGGAAAQAIGTRGHDVRELRRSDLGMERDLRTAGSQSEWRIWAGCGPTQRPAAAGHAQMTRDEYVSRYQALQALYTRVPAFVDGAKLLDDVLHDFELLCQGEDDAELTLDEAADLSGYSRDHLRRLVREQKLLAYKRGRRLFFRRANLPKKPATVDAPTIGGYDPVADARRVAT